MYRAKTQAQKMLAAACKQVETVDKATPTRIHVFAFRRTFCTHNDQKPENSLSAKLLPSPWFLQPCMAKAHPWQAASTKAFHWVWCYSAETGGYAATDSDASRASRRSLAASMYPFWRGRDQTTGHRGNDKLGKNVSRCVEPRNRRV